MSVERLRDGYPTTISLTSAGTTFWEKTVQPPGIDGGEPIDVTTMRNDALRTKAPRGLYDLTPVEVTIAYDPTVYDVIVAAVNYNQEIVTTFPDEGTVTWWGYLQKFVPEPNEEGKQPTARMTLIPTNMDASGAEIAPVTVAGSGTGA